MRADHEEFEAFARGHLAQLQRIAYLLCGDAHRTLNVVEDALARTWRHWRDIEAGTAPETLVLRSLAAAARRRQNMPPEPEAHRDDAEAARRDHLWCALQSLPARERVALVLAHLPDGVSPVPVDAVEVLGRRRAAQWHASAMERLAVAGVECHGDLLDETLAERAETTPADSPSIDHAFRVQRDRTRRSVLALAAGVTVTAAGTAFAFTRRTPGHQEAEPSPTPTGPPPTREEITPPLPWPVRGNLADDAAVLAGLRVAFASHYRSVVGGIQVLYAADLPSARVALLGGRDRRGEGYFAWLYGAPGTPPEQLSSWVADFPPLMVQEMRRAPAVWALGLETGHRMLVVFGPPTFPSVEVSWGPTYMPDGSVRRNFEPLPLDEGIAAFDEVEGEWRWVQVRLQGIGVVTPSPTGGTPTMPNRLGLSWTDYTSAAGDVWMQRTLDDLPELIPVVSADDVDLRVVWVGYFADWDDGVLIMRVTRRTGGEFLLASFERSRTITVSSIPAGSPELPAVWAAHFGDPLEFFILPPEGAVRMEFRQAGQIVTTRLLQGMELHLKALPEISSMDAGTTEVIMRDGDGDAMWRGTLQDLLGYAVDVWE